MDERKYVVSDKYAHCIASDMDLNTALLLIKAYCEKYFADEVMLTLVEMARHEERE